MVPIILPVPLSHVSIPGFNLYFFVVLNFECVFRLLRIYSLLSGIVVTGLDVCPIIGTVDPSSISTIVNTGFVHSTCTSENNNQGSHTSFADNNNFDFLGPCANLDIAFNCPNDGYWISSRVSDLGHVVLHLPCSPNSFLKLM